MYKKLILLKLFCLVTLFCNSSVFAYVSNNTNSINQEEIYCPDSIECKAAGISGKDIACKVNGSNLQYWGVDPTGTYWNRIGMAVGHYYLNVVGASYQSDRVSDARCIYKYEGSSPFPVGDFTIFIKNGSNFEAFYNNNTEWNVFRDSATCYSSNAKLCPMIQKNSIVFSNLVAGGDGGSRVSLEIAANGNLFRHDDTAHYYEMSYDQALKICGAVNQCELSIRESHSFTTVYDTVTIDMINNMKILQVKSSIRYGKPRPICQLKKDAVFNMIICTVTK